MVLPKNISLYLCIHLQKISKINTSGIAFTVVSWFTSIIVALVYTNKHKIVTDVDKGVWEAITDLQDQIDIILDIFLMPI